MHLLRYLCAAVVCLLAASSSASANDVFVYPANNSSTLVTKYSADPFAQLAQISPAINPQIILPSHQGTKVYFIGRSNTETVIVADAALGQIINRVALNSPAEAAALTPDGKYLVVAAGKLNVIDTTTDAVAAQITAGVAPSDVAISADSVFAYALDPSSNRLFEIDLTKLQATGRSVAFPGGDLTFNVSLSPLGQLLVSSTERIFLVDPVTMQIVTNVGTSGRPGNVVFSADGKFGYSPNLSTRSLLVFEMAPVFKLSQVIGDFTGTIDQIVPAGNDIVYVHSPTTLTVWKVNTQAKTFAPLTTVAQPITSIAGSPEAPNRKYFYALTGSTLFRINPANDQISGQAPVPAITARLRVAGRQFSGVPTKFIQFNAIQQLENGKNSGPLGVRVTDDAGVPLANVPVEWFSDDDRIKFISRMTLTNASGYAYATVQAPPAAGIYPVGARIGTATGIVANYQLALGVTAPGGGGGTPGGGTGQVGGVKRISGNGQIVRENFTTRDPLVIQVTDAQGKPVANAPVTWTITPMAGGAVLLDAGATRTDAQGIARAKFTGPNTVGFGNSILQSTVVAATPQGSATFSAITTLFAQPSGSGLAPPPLIELLAPGADRRITGKAGSVLPAAIRAKVTVNAGVNIGQPVPNVGLRLVNGANPALPAAANCRGGEPVTDSSGIATCDLEIGGNVGTNQLDLRVGGEYDFTGFRLTIEPAPPSKFNKLSGDAQVGSPGQAVALPLVAQLTDNFGTLFPGTTVVWDVVEGIAQLTDTVTRTDSSSRVSTRVVLGNQSGPVRVRVQIPGGPNAIFTLQSVVPFSQLKAISGGGQSVETNQAYPAPLVVQALTDQNNPVAGVNVQFAIIGGAGTLSAASAVTDAQGFARVNATAGNAPGNITVQASVGAIQTAFTLVAVAPKPPGPQINVLSFVNFASLKAGLSPGQVTTVYGAGLAPNIVNCIVPNLIVGPMPSALAGVTVKIGERFAPIYSVCNVNGQQAVTFQAPFETPPGATSATVTVGQGFTDVANIPVFDVNPGIFESPTGTGLLLAVVRRPDGVYVTSVNPALKGKEHIMYVTGLGAITPGGVTNVPGQGGQKVNAEIVVGVNDKGVQVISSEYSKNLVGVYEVKFLVPADTPTNSQIRLAIAVRKGNELVFGQSTVIPVE